MGAGWLHKVLDRLHIDGRDLPLFGVSLLLAFSIWLIHNLTLSYSAVVSVPVVAESNIEGHARTSSNSTIIAARCRLSGYHIVRLNFHSSRTKVVYIRPEDFKKVDGDMFTISQNVLSGYVSAIFGEDVQLESFASGQVEFRFPVENHRKVPVHIISLFSYKSQYTGVGAVSLQPDSVTVYGEPGIIENVDRVLTEAVTHKNLSSSVHGVAKLEAPSGVRLSAGEVNYSLDVTRYVTVSREVKIGVHNVPSGRSLSVIPSTATVTYRCVFPLSSDPTANIRFHVDYPDFTHSIGGKLVPKPSSIPAGVIDYELDPPVFECLENFSK